MVGCPDHMREEGVSRRRGYKNVWYRMAQNFTCMWGLESFPTFVHQGKGKGQGVVDQERAGPSRRMVDGGELELSQTLRLCRTCSTSSPAEGKRSTAHDNRGSYSMRYLRPLWCGIAGGADGYDSHGEVIDVARGIGLHKHGRW